MSATTGTQTTDADRASHEARLYRLVFGAAMIGWLLVAAMFILFAPERIRWPNAVLSIIGGSVITLAVNRPSPRRSIVAAALFDVLGLALPTYSPGGFAVAMVFPLLGSLLLVASYRGRKLAGAFVLGWLVSIAGMTISFVVGPMGLLSSLSYPAAVVATGAILTGLAYVALWWVASNWGNALRNADAATLQLRALIEQAADGILVLDRDGRVVEVNRAVEAVLGRGKADLLGHTAAELLALASGDGLPTDLSTLQPGASELSEQTVTNGEGAEIQVEFRISAMTDGRYQVIARDITDRRRAEGERARLAAALEQAADLVIISDSAGIIEYVNPAFERLTGYSAAEVIGRPVASAVRSNVHPPEFYAGLDGAFARGEPWQGMITDRRRDGSLFEYELSISPIRAPDGAIVGAVHVGRDTSHERALEADLALEANVRSVLETALRGVPWGPSLEQAAQALCDALGTLSGIEFVAVFAFPGADEIEAVAHYAPRASPKRMDRQPPELSACARRRRSVRGQRPGRREPTTGSGAAR